MGAREVRPEAITEVAEEVAEKIDVLLERATDTVLGAPQPGSDAWQQAWAARDTDAGRAALANRTRIKAAIAQAAGVDPGPELERARRAGIVTDDPTAEPPPERAKRRRRPGDEDQLSMW
ncbi:hypothetical protein [Prescottella equi]|uniref:Uncharacterized protein n=1 Tax=Rhodococcus hoagii TaxID=43767 RepID=A0A1Z1UVI8_RHOHA|nr:hypothetical protein [Prescottella equi]ARX59518.1 hypothetical protein pVAPA1271_0740 [Prescottella equi]BDC75061.1 hypothetical protein KAREA_49760 [Prescottella equi]SUE07118.1 Uncharacterised protein [Prescottella equi]